MRALLVGGSGFIGSHLVDALLGRGIRVRVYGRSQEQFRVMPAEVDFCRGNFDDTALLSEALADVDIVYHLISTTVPATANIDPAFDIMSNLIGTVKLLELMRHASVRRIVFLSSGGTVYGAPQAAMVAETHPEQPISSYGIVKLAIEKYLLMETRLHGLRPLILRASNPYGPRQGHNGVQGVIGTFLWRIAAGEPIRVWGDGSIVRDFIHVADLAQLCADGATAGVTGVFNAGSGVGTSIQRIVEIISQVTGREIDVNYEAGRGFDVPRVVLDIASIQAQISWAPATPLAEGIDETWRWILGQLP